MENTHKTTDNCLLVRKDKKKHILYGSSEKRFTEGQLYMLNIQKKNLIYS